MFPFIERFKNWADDLDIDYCKYRYYFMSVSGLLVALSVILFFTVGPNYNTDFTGGTDIHLKFEKPIEIEQLRKGLVQLGLPNDCVSSVNGATSGEFDIRIGDPTFGMEGLEDEVRAALTKLYGPTWIKDVTGSAEVSARFVVNYTGDSLDYKKISRDLQPYFLNSRAAPGKEDNQVAIEIPGLDDRIKQKIAAEFPGQTFQVLQIDSVGPRVGAELRRTAFVSLTATMALILVYVAFRFDVEFAPGGVIALIHDVTLTVGVFIIFQLDFSLQTVGALLTILGYSINDTIVIYDRVRENKDKFRRTDIVTLINKSVNETMTRTLATNFTVFLAIMTFLIWGGPVLRDFAIAMLCGQIFGTYSTVYIASPLVIIFEDFKPWFNRMIAVGDLGDEEPTAPIGGGDDPSPNSGGPPMSESEKRRRARADAEKRDQIG